MGRILVTRIEAALEEEFQYFQVITDTDILTVSDGTSFVIAHTCGTDNLVASQVELLAAALDEARDVGKSLIVHDDFSLIWDKDNVLNEER